MGQIYITRRLVLLTFAVAVRKKYFLNRSCDENFYVIELNLVSYFWPRTEFFPRTMKLSQKVSKMGDIVRNVYQKTEIFIPLLIFLVTAKKSVRDRKLKLFVSKSWVDFCSKHI